MNTEVDYEREALLRKLKINVKSLAAEACFNRKEKQKASHGLIKWDLNHHRTGKLRHEARVTQLAYVFVRGVPYRAVENKVKDPAELEYVCSHVERKLRKFGVTVSDVKLSRWFKAKACARKASVA